MKLYIRSTGNISPQKTFGHPELLAELIGYPGNRLYCIEPEYKTFIDLKQIRRMSRIIRMGVAAAMECLREADIPVPDAIVTGTAYGCLEDTGIFLSKMVEQQEELLAPTAFIQSTHNTVGAQIALMLHCNGYNNVFVHLGLSFESALLDATLLLKEGEANNVLVGGMDETTNISHTLLSRFGLYKKELESTLNLFDISTKGTIAGEGAAFFLLANEPSASDYAQLEGMATFYNNGSLQETESRIANFLLDQSIAFDEIDLVITGRNGDVVSDKIYSFIEQSAFKNIPAINYKHLCGEYPTSTAFALWLGVNIIKSGALPASMRSDTGEAKQIKRILIYNNFQHTHHSLVLISAC